MAVNGILRKDFRGEASVVCPNSNQPFYAAMFPPPSEAMPPLILHILAPKELSTAAQFASSVIAEATYLPLNYIEELIPFGGVYNGNADGKKPGRMRSDVAIEPGSYLRVHVNPKRYQNRIAYNFRIASKSLKLVSNFRSCAGLFRTRYVAVYSVDWASCIIAETNDFLVIDKPPGVPSQPLIDNLVECVPFQIQKAIDNRCQALITSRLDVATSGLVLLAKNPEVVAEINALIRNNAISKQYLLVCNGDHSLGVVRHFFRTRKHKKRCGRDFLIRSYSEDHDPEDWADSSLILLSKHELKGYFSSPFEYRVELISGRTHQIRLQMAALGSPLLDDSRYEPANGMLENNLPEDADFKLGPDPLRIGLQAAQLRFTWRGKELVFDAPDPWWRS